MQVDFHCTNFGTISTKGGGMAKVFPLAKFFEVGGYNTSNGTAVSGTIAVSSDILVYRTGVQAGSTTDTIKALP
jgi:hypothetical protein